VNEDIIKKRFLEFGNIVSVKMVRDSVFGTPKGTCFIQFDNTEAVKRVLEVAKTKDTFNPLQRFSQDASEKSILLKGRKLLVDVAMDRNNAQKLFSDKKRKMDKRNLYLAKEGIVLSETDMKGMTKEELQRRVEAWTIKKKKLENPNFHVSCVRLLIRNVPKFVTEKRLKAVFNEAATKIREQHHEDNNKKLITSKYEYKNPKIEQCVIVRDKKRVDINGYGRSKRYGFAQFREHIDALCVLRELNNKTKFI